MDLGVETGLFKKVSNRVELPTGEKIYAKVMYTEPSKYFTDDVMVELEKRAKEKFCYGINEPITVESISTKSKQKVDEELTETITLIDNEVE